MEYILIRAVRKTVSIQVKDGEVIVRAPLRMSGRMIDQFVISKEDWILSVLEKQKERMEKYPAPTPEEIKLLKKQAKEYIPPKVEYYSNIMGLYPTDVKINSAKKRFGSCSGKNSINFSCLLMRYPQEAIDYVIVHELAHIKHKNHGREFYLLVESVLPDWKKRAKLLRGYD